MKNVLINNNLCLKKLYRNLPKDRSSHIDVFFRKDVLKICSIFTGKHQSRGVISAKLQSNFIEIALRHECSPVTLLHSFRTPSHLTNLRRTNLN